MQQIKDAIKQIGAYFNLPMSEYDTKRVESILMKLPTETVKIETRVEYIEIPVPVTQISENLPTQKLSSISPVRKKMMNETLGKICGLYGVDADNIFTTKCRKLDWVKAKCHFVRYVVLKYPDMSFVSIGDFCNADHTFVNYYLYECNVDISIPPFPKRKKVAQFN